MSHPNFVMLYVENPTASAEFYSGLLGQAPVEASPTFALFVLPSGLKLGLWSRYTVEPAATVLGGGSELAIQVPDAAAVEATHQDWSARGLNILQAPFWMDFGYSFVALDPDGHRLRVYTLAEAE